MTVPRLNPSGRFDPARLFHPGSVAVLGADSDAGAHIMANLMVGGFKGQILTEPAPNTHLAVLALPPEKIGPAMQALAEANCFAAIVPGPCDNLAELSARTGVRALGPHSFGLAVPGMGLNATRSHMPPPTGRIALVSQSSALSRAIIDWAEPNGVGFSHIVGIGGNAGVGFGPTLDWLSRDAGTGAILLDIRRIKNHRVFLSAARAAARLRPVVAIRAGLQLGNDHADLSFEAALRRAGVLYVRRLEDLLAAAETLSCAKPARFDTLAIVSNAIGPGRLAADSVVRHGLHLPDGGIKVVANADLPETVFDLATRGEVGGVLAVHAPFGMGHDSSIDALAHPPDNIRSPILVCAMGETVGDVHRSTLTRGRIAAFETPDQAVQGFFHLVEDRRNREAARELPPRTVLSVAPDKASVGRILSTAQGPLSQDHALDILSAYAIPVAPTRTAETPEDAAAAADALGYPVVVKQRSSHTPADRPAGGLIFDLHDSAAVRFAAALLAERARRRGEDQGLLVQHQVGRAREMAVRVGDDATFGPAIFLGPGGTTADVEEAADLPPLNLALAHGLIRRSKAGAMLGKVLRDRPAANTAALAEALVRISQLILDFPEIGELQIPSLFVDAQGVVVADAWLSLRDPDAPLAALAIAPYPEELVEHATIGTERITIRPIRPEDAEAHRAFFSRLSPQDIRYRFFSAMRELTPEHTVRLTQVDYDREMAFIAVDETTGDTVGVSRLASEPGGESGEFAVIVQASMKGKGLATRLMRRLIDWARSQGMKEVTGQILADNAPMLAFIRHAGFQVHRMTDDPEVMESKLTL